MLCSSSDRSLKKFLVNVSIIPFSPGESSGRDSATSRSFAWTIHRLLRVPIGVQPKSVIFFPARFATTFVSCSCVSYERVTSNIRWSKPLPLRSNTHTCSPGSISGRVAKIVLYRPTSFVSCELWANTTALPYSQMFAVPGKCMAPSSRNLLYSVPSVRLEGSWLWDGMTRGTTTPIVGTTIKESAFLSGACGSKLIQ